MQDELITPPIHDHAFDRTPASAGSTLSADRLRTLAIVTVVALALQGALVLLALAVPGPVAVHATVAQIAIFFFTMFPFLSWLGACYDEVAVQGPLEQSKNLTLGGFFIPIYNLIGPFLAARQVYQRAGAYDARGSGIVWVWWGLWIARSHARAFMPGALGAALIELAAIAAAIAFVYALTRRLRPATHAVVGF